MSTAFPRMLVRFCGMVFIAFGFVALLLLVAALLGYSVLQVSNWVLIAITPTLFAVGVFSVWFSFRPQKSANLVE